MSSMNSSMYIVRRSIWAPVSFFAERAPMALPYFQTADLWSNLMLLLVLSGIIIFGIFPVSSSW